MLIALIPFIIAPIAFIAAMGLWFGRPFSKDMTGVTIGTLGALLVFDVPICAYVLIKWLGSGIAPDLVCELMMTTPEERELHRNLRNRQKLDDDAFYETFYKESGVPKHLVVQLRWILGDVTGYDLAGLHPADNLAYIDSEMDFADVLYRLERDFNTKLDWDELRRSEVTFDFLLQMTVRCIATTSSQTLAPSTASDD